MDALEFLRERKRMCDSYRSCMGCPFGVAECVVKDMIFEDNCERIVSAVAQWSKEHPRKTMQSVFLEKYPKALREREDILSMCPRYVDSNIQCHGACNDCRREFWMQEVE